MTIYNFFKAIKTIFSNKFFGFFFPLSIIPKPDLKLKALEAYEKIIVEIEKYSEVSKIKDSTKARTIRFIELFFENRLKEERFRVWFSQILRIKKELCQPILQKLSSSKVEYLLAVNSAKASKAAVEKNSKASSAAISVVKVNFDKKISEIKKFKYWVFYLKLLFIAGAILLFLGFALEYVLVNLVIELEYLDAIAKMLKDYNIEKMQSAQSIDFDSEPINNSKTTLEKGFRYLLIDFVKNNIKLFSKKKLN